VQVKVSGGRSATGSATRRRTRPCRRSLPIAGVAVLTAAALALAGCDSGGAEPGPTLRSESTRPSPRTAITFGVYGEKPVRAAFEGVVDTYNANSEDSTIRLRTWASHDEMVKDLKETPEGTTPQMPDVFMASRSDLAWLQAKGLTQPVDEMLDERGVDFGDVYSRDALEAFSSDNRLQCMPYGVSPQVVFYNQALVDLDRMAARGLDVPPEDHRRFSWDQFVAAAKFAARPARGTKGVSIDPTLTGIAPFVYSGGGNLFNDDQDPTSTAFAGDGTQGALETALQVLRDPKLTLTQDQLAKRSALEWFEQGKVGMIVGSRELVPQLRKVPGLSFDVLPIPSIEGQATIGDITALCIAKDAESPATAADFMVYASGTDAVSQVARVGYLQPANQEVAFSDDFLQPGQMPATGTVFNESVTRMVIPPLLDVWDELEEAVEPYLQQMFYTEPTIDLPLIGSEIDSVSQPILSPPTASPTPGTGSPSPSQSP
jgi:multiple sugar transport system substrate-binding protein